MNPEKNRFRSTTKTITAEKCAASFRGILRTPQGSTILVAIENMPILSASLSGLATNVHHSHPAELIEEEWALGNANKFTHLFNNAGHNLDPLLEKLGGDQEQVVSQVVSAAAQKADYATQGTQEFNVNVEGMWVTVRGAISDGYFKLGTFFQSAANSVGQLESEIPPP